jgi:hypothetical protein
MWLKARPNGGMDLKQLVGIDTDCPPGARGALEARQCGTSVSGLTLARASAHQASAGRWTAAGDHAPIVERSIANQQHAHHPYQADPSILPRQPAPRDPVGCQASSDPPRSPKPACHVEQPLTLAICCWPPPRPSPGHSALICYLSCWERTDAPALPGGIDHTNMVVPNLAAWHGVGLADLGARLDLRLVRPAGHAHSPALADDRLGAHQLSRRRLPGGAAADALAGRSPVVNWSIRL